MAGLPIKPLISFGDPAQNSSDTPCSLCLHTFPGRESLSCNQCKQRVHMLCWVFLKNAFQDLNGSPCGSCQLPLDSAIYLALRGLSLPEDTAAAEVLKRRVFFARRATNEARWSVGKDSPRDEAIEIALQSMRQAIPLPQRKKPQMHHTLAPEQDPHQDQEHAIPMSSVEPTTRSEVDDSWRLLSETQQEQVVRPSRPIEFQQIPVLMDNFQSQSSHSAQTYQSSTASPFAPSSVDHFPIPRNTSNAFLSSFYTQSMPQQAILPVSQGNREQRSGISLVNTEQTQGVQHSSLALRHLIPDIRMPSSNVYQPSQLNCPTSHYSSTTNTRQDPPFSSTFMVEDEDVEIA